MASVLRCSATQAVDLDERIAVQLRGHRVEGLGQLLELVAGRDVHPGLEVAPGDRLGPAGQGQQRQGQLPRQERRGQDRGGAHEEQHPDRGPLHLERGEIGLLALLQHDHGPAHRGDRGIGAHPGHALEIRDVPGAHGLRLQGGLDRWALAKAARGRGRSGGPWDRRAASLWRRQARANPVPPTRSETRAMKPSELSRVIVDTTVQPKNITYPTDAKLLNRAREKLVKLAKEFGVELRQSYTRVGKFALIQHQRYAHAKQFKRANRALRTLKTYLGRVIRDIARKIEGKPGLEAKFAWLLSLARRVRAQERGQRGPKVYSLHAPEVECIGKGKPHKPYEFGVKVSVATTLKHSKGGQFVAHVQALPGNPYDGHTLAEVIPAIEQLVGNTIERLHTDAGYRGHNAPPEYKFKIYTAKQKRRVTPVIKREMKRRSAVEPVIGHLKEEHRMGRNYLAHRRGDFNNAILAAVGYNFRRLIRWLRILLRLFLAVIFAQPNTLPA